MEIGGYMCPERLEETEIRFLFKVDGVDSTMVLDEFVFCSLE